MQGFGYDTIDRLFESAAQLGLTVGRTWAMNYGMPQEPGGRRQHGQAAAEACLGGSPTLASRPASMGAATVPLAATNRT